MWYGLWISSIPSDSLFWLWVPSLNHKNKNEWMDGTTKSLKITQIKLQSNETTHEHNICFYYIPFFGQSKIGNCTSFQKMVNTYYSYSLHLKFVFFFKKIACVERIKLLLRMWIVLFLFQLVMYSYNQEVTLSNLGGIFLLLKETDN
jgi:hypothetical protein